METDKVKVKPDKARKAAQSIEEILKSNTLATFQDRAMTVVSRRNQLLASSRMDEIKRDIALYQDQLKQLNARKTSMETHEAVKEHAEIDVQEKIRNIKRLIEKNIYSFLNKRVEIL
jgi:hypothetical protein